MRYQEDVEVNSLVLRYLVMLQKNRRYIFRHVVNFRGLFLDRQFTKTLSLLLSWQTALTLTISAD